MCPVCWATLLASFSIFSALSAVVVAVKDILSWALAAVTIGAALAHRANLAWFPWWAFIALIVALASRIGWLTVWYRDQLLIVTAWQRAADVAKLHCPVGSGDDFSPSANALGCKRHSAARKS